MMLFLLFLWTIALGRQIHQIIAIQQTDQIYTSYIPYISSCDYNQPYIQKGNAQFVLMDDKQIFYQTQQQGYYTFWSAVKNGLYIMTQGDRISIDYDGYILLDSPLVKGENRYFMLYKIGQGDNNTINFYKAFATMYVPQQNITVQTTQQYSVYFDQTIFKQNCTNQEIIIEYFGDNSYLIVCKNTGLGYTFQFQMGNYNYSNFTLYNISLTEKQILLPIVDITTNPKNLQVQGDPFSYQINYGIDWNIIILSASSIAFNQSYTSYFAKFNGNSQNYTYYNYSYIKLELDIIIDRIYGAQQIVQQSRWQILFKQVSNKEDIFFPGDVVSVFVNDRDDVYVQSSLGDTNYLNIFEDGQKQIANISYTGYIVYYSFRNIFIYNFLIEKYYKLKIQRPILTILNKNHTERQYITVNFTVNCSDLLDLQLSYQILWTSVNIPSAKIFPISQTPLYSKNYICSFNIFKKFKIIGPSYHVYVNATPNIQVTILDSDIITIQSQVNAVIDIKLVQQTLNTYVNLLFASDNIILSVRHRFNDPQASNLFIKVKQPCGFTSIWSGKKVIDGYLVRNVVGEECFCDSDFIKCKIVNQNQVHRLMTKSYHRNSPQYATYMAQKNQNKLQNITDTIQIKKNLFGLINRGLIVSILTNNTILLQKSITFQVIDMIYIDCPGFNETDADLYIRSFYDAYLLAFCYENTKLQQYIIRKESFSFQRYIPLYGFKTRKDAAFFIGLNYAYLSVNLINQIIPTSPSCCVLRLDPTQFTVSVIQQIIQTNNVIGVVSRNAIDIALYSGQVNGTNFFKIYFSQIFVTLNQTQMISTKKQQEIQVVFFSNFYNFASTFPLNISFDFSQYDLQLQNGSDVVYDKVVLDQHINKYGTPQYNESLQYSFNRICGPIYSAVFQNITNTNQSIFQIQINNITMPNKLLGKVGEYFIQIIQPSKYNIEDLTLNNLIIVVAQSHMYFYQKRGIILQMYQIDCIPLIQIGCTYNLYNYINETAAQFITNCQAPNYQLLTPFLRLNYQDGIISYQFLKVFQFQQLTQLFTIVRYNQATLMVGLAEGPMKSKTGKLFICQLQLCAPLYISTQVQFLVSFDAYVKNNFYVVMSLDSRNIQVFIQPVIYNSSLIQSNYTISILNLIDKNDICSVLKISHATQKNAYIVLACTKQYYYINMTYQTGQLDVINIFNRYGECSLYDKFRPAFVINQRYQVQVMVTVCNQNQATLKLQSFQTLNQSPTIYTGYLQIFTKQGPKCGSKTYDTIKIIPLSTSITHPLYLVYQIQGQMKLIYSQINGFLIDNFLQTQPALSISFRPLTTVIQLPTLYIGVQNPYDILTNVISTTTQQIYYPDFVAIASFVIFCIMLIINFLFLMCFCISLQTKKRRQTPPHPRQSGLSFIHEIQYDDTATVVKEMKKQKRKDKTPEKSRITQIQLFYIKNIK